MLSIVLRLLLSFLVLLLSPMSVMATQTATILPLNIPRVLQQGSIERLTMKAPNDFAYMQLKVGDKLVPLHHSGNGIFEGLFAVAMDQPPGKQLLTFAAYSPNGDALTIDQQIEIQKKNWPIEHLQISKKFIERSKQEKERIRREYKLISSKIRQVSPKKLWQYNFSRPTPGIIRSPFGIRRTQNGKPRSSHGGVDFRAPTGTKIFAANNGIVLIADDFFMPGNAVYIDHGQGLVTCYFHLSKVIAKAGQTIKKGELLGLSGATGRVNGPHLHWQATWMGEKFNPLDLFKLY